MEVNDYVRTNKGMIAKIVDKKDVSGSLHNEEIVFILDNGNTLAINSMKVVKSSPNIIDLIEVGDYVNGDRVKALKGNIESHKVNNKEDVIYTEYINDYGEWCGYEEDEIKSIVTKEQFESMEYKL